MISMFLLIVISQDIRANALESSESGIDFSGLHRNTSFRIAAIPNRPFMSQDEEGRFSGGIEYELIKIIVTGKHLKPSFENRNNSSEYHQQELNKFDIIAGGVFPNVSFTEKFVFSEYYYQDDLTWCIQRSGYFPLILNIFFIAQPECFILIIFAVGYGTGLLLYFIIQLDLGYKHRNQRDWHYTTWLVLLPAVIGVNLRYQPRHFVIRFILFLVSITCFMHWQIFFYELVRFLQNPVPKAQISTVHEIIENDFRLCGSTEVRQLISFDHKYKRSQVGSYHVCNSLDSCLEDLKKSENSDLAVGGSRQRILNSQSYSPSSIFCFDEKIASFQPRMMINKDFESWSKVKRMTRYAFEGGLLKGWKTKVNKKKHLHRFNSEHGITLEEWATILVFMLFSFLLLATLTFSAEHFIFRILKKGSRYPLWILFGRFFDGKRYYFKNVSYRLHTKVSAEPRKKRISN